MTVTNHSASTVTTCFKDNQEVSLIMHRMGRDIVHVLQTPNAHQLFHLLLGTVV